MSLRPPPPNLRPLLAEGVRLELRKLASQGASVGGRGMHAVDAHELGQRDVVVRVDSTDRAGVLMYGPDGVPHRAVADFTPAFREAFYTARWAQRRKIEERLQRREPDVARPPAEERGATTSMLAHPHALAAMSPLDALKPLARQGWPFDDLREAASEASTRPRTTDRTDAPPLR